VSRWPTVKLGDVLEPAQRPEVVDALREYRLLGVRLESRGPFLREIKTGAETSAKTLFRVRVGDFIYSRLFAWRGAFGVIPPQLDGCYVSNEFPIFVSRDAGVDPHYLNYWLRLPAILERIAADCTGSTPLTRNRYKEHFFLELEMPLPPIEEQRRVVEKLNRLADLAHRGERQMASTGLSMRALVPARLNELAAKWSRSGTLADVLTGKPKNGWSARCDGDPGGVAVLALGAVTGFDYRAREHKRTSLPTDPGADYWLRPGDLLMTRSNTPQLVGHAAIYDGTPAPCIYPDLVMRLPVDVGKALPRFVWYWLQSPIARKHVQMLSKGTSPTMAKIGQGTVMAMPFPAGIALGTQERLVAELDRLTEVSGRAANVARRRNEEMAGVLLATLAELMGPA
jgi:type I restriction enzyme S subunit